MVVAIGGIAGISPDISKYYGDIAAHSIWLVPWLGMMIGIIGIFILRDISFVKWSLVASISVFSHIIIDYIGNGVALFYPIVKEDADFSIINSVDYWVICILVCALMTGVFFRRGRRIMTILLFVVLIYLLFLSFSKIQFEQALTNKYQDQQIRLLITYPESNFQWAFQVRTNDQWVNGHTSIFKLNIHEDSVTKAN